MSELGLILSKIGKVGCRVIALWVWTFTVSYSILYCRLTSITGSSWPRASNSGRRTYLMKPTWEDDLVTFSRSINGATGRPSSFSISLCTKGDKHAYTVISIVIKISTSFSMIITMITIPISQITKDTP